MAGRSRCKCIFLYASAWNDAPVACLPWPPCRAWEPFIQLIAMKIMLTTFFLTAICTAACTQTLPGDTLDYTTRPEIWPIFYGCDTLDNLDERKACSGRKMLHYIYVHFKMPDVGDAYPCSTMAATFIIEKDGSVNDAVIERELHPLMDAELLRVITSMPRWMPATTNGLPVRFKMNLPLRISLE